MSQQALLIVVIVVAVLAAVAGLVVLGLFLWRRTVKRYLVGLIGRREGVRAGLKSLEGVVTGLAGFSDGELVAFALDASSEERRALGEIASQMRIAAEDLATMALPKHLVDAANELSDGAELLWEQAEAAAAGEGVEVLDALAAIDLAAVRRHLQQADSEFEDLKNRYNVDEQAVYGGGLYI
ncbi:MAG: hypothetical protein ACYC77_04735 [Coriobacteriia bacterium]